MTCPKCGAQVDDKETMCPYCKEELKAEQAQAEQAEAKAEEKTEEKAEQTEQAAEAKETAANEKKQFKVDFKNPKTLITCVAAVVAVIILIAAIFGIISIAKKNVGPEKTAENYVEAMVDGNIRKAFKKTAPWVLRDIADGLDIKENASVGKIVKEYEDQMGDFGLGGKIIIEDVALRAYTDSAIGEALTDLDILEDYEITYKEVKAITEIAMVEVEASIKILTEKETATFVIYCARYDGDWVIIDFDSDY